MPRESEPLQPLPDAPRARGRSVYRFIGADRGFSNMYWAPVAWGDEVTAVGLWPFNELPYVLAKTSVPALRADGIALFREAERSAPGSGSAAVNRWGKGLVLRPDWESVREAVMLALVRDKFARNRELEELLLATGNGEIEEGNDWGDVYWGVALHDDPERGIKAGSGRNRLGQILMQVRDELGRGEYHLATMP